MKHSRLVRNLFLLLFALTSLSLHASVDFPGTPAGNRAKEILGLLNGTGSDSPEDYIKNNYTPDFRDAFPMASHVAIFSTTRAIFGRLQLLEIAESTSSEITAVLKSVSREAYLKVELDVEPEDPHRIVSMGISPADRPADADEERSEDGSGSRPPEAKDPESVDLDDLHNQLSERAKNDEFSGVVLIAKDGNEIFHEAYGYASREFKVKNALDTKFNLGSINKLFTAIGIAQLMEKGMLSVDDPIGKYLDIFPEEIASEVTVRHLLQMRAGWGDHWDNEYYLAHRSELRKVSDYMKFIQDIPLDFEPGTNFQHCNTCFQVLGALIEAITEMDYYDYIRGNIYEPAGMENTDSYDKDSPVANIAVGYTKMNPNAPSGEKARWNNLYMMPPKGSPAGGGFSTAEDLLKLDIALRDFRLLNRDYTHYLLRQFDGSPKDPFELPGRVSRSVGGAPGVSAVYARDLNSGYTIVVLSNYDYPAAVEVANEIMTTYGLE
jgi:CubicO group peptidase (beta-lactamase class C family)